MHMDELVGTTIEGVSISKDRRVVRFSLRGRAPMAFLAEADCCSASWVEEFDFTAITGGTVVRVDVKDVCGDGRLLATAYPDYQQEVDAAYFYEIVTDRGSATLEMRNSSNGYYGGWMTLAED